MSIFVPEDVLQRHPTLPVICGSCGHQMTFASHSPELDAALIDSTYLHESRCEFTLLERTASLFARFPDSRYALKVGKEQLHPKQFPRTSRDPEFEAALASDPELLLFLRRSIFHLPSRQRGVADLIARLEQRDFSAVRCPVCEAGPLRLPAGFLH